MPEPRRLLPLAAHRLYLVLRFGQPVHVLGMVEAFGIGGFRTEKVEGKEVKVRGEEDVLALGGGCFLNNEVLGWGVMEDDVFEMLDVCGDVGEGEGHVWSVRVLEVVWVEIQVYLWIYERVSDV